MELLSTLLDNIGGLFSLEAPAINSLEILRAVLGTVLVFFLPGFAWTLVFFKRIHIIERVALAIGLSIALVTLSMLFLNLVTGLKIIAANSIGVILVITAVPFIIYAVNRFRRRRGLNKA